MYVLFVLSFPPLVSVYGLFPVLVSCNLDNSCPGVCGL